jgi:hypothetical protein
VERPKITSQCLTSNIADPTMRVNARGVRAEIYGKSALFRDALVALCTASGHRLGRNC